jgi:hypothetical protein
MYFLYFLPSSLLANSHILRSVRWQPTETCTVTHARDHWWTLDFANAFVSPGVNSRAELVPSPRSWLGDYFMIFKHRNHSWSFVVIHGHSWSFMVIRGHSWSFVVIRVHSWSLVCTFRQDHRNRLWSNENGSWWGLPVTIVYLPKCV